MTEQKVSLRFARALIVTATEAKLTNEVYDDLKLVDVLLKSSKEFTNMTKSPVIRHWVKRNAMKEVLDGKVNQLTFNFILLLIQKGRVGLISAICNQYEILYYLLNNRLVVEITSAVEMSAEQKKKTEMQIAENTQKEIIASYKVDATVQGGIMVKIGDWVFDATVKNQLKHLHKRLAEDYN
jgi:F-type H+-transporting ATPase subunit delta